MRLFLKLDLLHMGYMRRNLLDPRLLLFRNRIIVAMGMNRAFRPRNCCVPPPLDRMVGDMDSDSVIMSGEDTERSLISSSSSGGSGSRDSGGGSGANADNDDDNDDEYDEDFNDSEGLSDTAPPPIYVEKYSNGENLKQW